MAPVRLIWHLMVIAAAALARPTAGALLAGVFVAATGLTSWWWKRDPHHKMTVSPNVRTLLDLGLAAMTRSVWLAGLVVVSRMLPDRHAGRLAPDSWLHELAFTAAIAMAMVFRLRMFPPDIVSALLGLVLAAQLVMVVAAIRRAKISGTSILRFFKKSA